jgi:hypothetical protein
MIKRTLGLAIAGTVIAAAAFAAPPKGGDTKVVALHTCPVTNEAVKGAGSGSEVVGKYKVTFCCAGCKPQFDAKSAKEKAAILAKIAKAEASKKKG